MPDGTKFDMIPIIITPGVRDYQVLPTIIFLNARGVIKEARDIARLEELAKDSTLPPT